MFEKKQIRIGVLIIVLVSALGFLLVYFSIIKLPLSSLPILQKKPDVKLKTEYKNPFSKETQYVNPFAKYKNPFVTNK